MDTLSLELAPRSVTGKKVKHLRAAGLVPVSICGRGVTPENFETDARIFGRVYQIAGRSALIELKTPTGVRQAFIREIQRHPITGVWVHVDFRVVDLKMAMTADIPVVLVGENTLVTRGDALPNLALPVIRVHALPAELPQNIEIDIAQLADYDTTIHVRDLQLGDSVEVLTPGDEVVAMLSRSTTASDAEELIEQEQLEQEEAHPTAEPTEEEPEATEETEE